MTRHDRKQVPKLELINKIRSAWTYKKSDCHISSSKWLKVKAYKKKCLKVGKIKLLESYLIKRIHKILNKSKAMTH